MNRSYCWGYIFHCHLFDCLKWFAMRAGYRSKYLHVLRRRLDPRFPPQVSGVRCTNFKLRNHRGVVRFITEESQVRAVQMFHHYEALHTNAMYRAICIIHGNVINAIIIRCVYAALAKRYNWFAPLSLAIAFIFARHNNLLTYQSAWTYSEKVNPHTGGSGGGGGIRGKCPSRNVRNRRKFAHFLKYKEIWVTFMQASLF